MNHSVQYVIIIIRDYSSIPLFYNGCFTTQWIKGAYEVHESARSKDKTKTLPSTHFLWKRIMMSFIWIFKEDLLSDYHFSFHIINEYQCLPFRRHIISLQDVLGCQSLDHIVLSFPLTLRVLDHLKKYSDVLSGI